VRAFVSARLLFGVCPFVLVGSALVAHGLHLFAKNAHRFAKALGKTRQLWATPDKQNYGKDNDPVPTLKYAFEHLFFAFWLSA
jgi:hypothetical protein